MINGCLVDGLPAPEFYIQPTMFSITFRIRNNEGDENALSGDVKGDVKGSVNIGVNVGVNIGVNKTQQKIIELMAVNSDITAEKLAEAIGITKRRIEANISELKASGIIERIGADKKGYWVVKGK